MRRAVTSDDRIMCGGPHDESTFPGIDRPAADRLSDQRGWSLWQRRSRYETTCYRVIAVSGNSADGGLAGILVPGSGGRTDGRALRSARRQILDTTVYFRFTLDCAASGEVFYLSVACTVMDEQTVLTHDHYTDFDEPGCAIVAMEVFTGRGKSLTKYRDPAQLDDMLRRLRRDGDGSRTQARKVAFPLPLFTDLHAAVFESFASLPADNALTEWGEVAEINGEPFPWETRIQWVRPLSTEAQGQALGLVLDQAVYHGASGGGVFRYAAGQLVHIGNVWGTWEEDHRSLVALNRAEVLR